MTHVPTAMVTETVGTALAPSAMAEDLPRHKVKVAVHDSRPPHTKIPKAPYLLETDGNTELPVVGRSLRRVWRRWVR